MHTRPTKLGESRVPRNVFIPIKNKGLVLIVPLQQMIIYIITQPIFANTMPVILGAC